jgi:hypothetical protein
VTRLNLAKIVRFEVLTAATVKNAVFWDVTSFGSVLQLPVTAIVVPRSLILVPPMMEAIRSSEKSVLTGATRRKILEDGIRQSARR